MLAGYMINKNHTNGMTYKEIFYKTIVNEGDIRDITVETNKCGERLLFNDTDIYIQSSPMNINDENSIFWERVLIQYLTEGNNYGNINKITNGENEQLTTDDIHGSEDTNVYTVL